MVAGRLQEKNGYWYVILSLLKEDGRRGPKWFAIGLKTPYNKKQAEEIMQNLRREYTDKECLRTNSGEVLFADYMLHWLDSMKGRVKTSTHYIYSLLVKNNIVPYFREWGYRMKDLRPGHIEAYYHTLYAQGCSHSTVWRHHANIHKALKEAVKHEYIPTNPASLVERPPRQGYISNPYSTEETNQLLRCVKDESIEMIVVMAVFYGMRRSEVLGLRWQAIDFQKETITVSQTVLCNNIKGGYIVTAEEKMKTSASYRTLPMPETIASRLKKIQTKRFGNRPCKQQEHIFINGQGKIMNPNYVTAAFSQLLKKYGLRPIRFHDLRHGCAGMLISNRVPLIEVQHWLGHSNISTTADLYTHLEFAIKERSAQTMDSILELPD